MMDFDLETVKNELADTELELLNFKKLKWLGEGIDGVVRRKGSLAIKKHGGSFRRELDASEAKLLIELGEQGIKRGIHFAPTLDYTRRGNSDETNLTVMPYIKGAPLDHIAPQKIMELGKEKVDLYFEDFRQLTELGFRCDFWSPENTLITDSHINFIDLKTNKFKKLAQQWQTRVISAPQIIDKLALYNLLSNIHDSSYIHLKEYPDKQKTLVENFHALTGMVESVITKRKHGKFAHNLTKIFSKSNLRINSQDILRTPHILFDK